MENVNEVKIPGDENNKEIIITTNHAASSYGMPVAIDENGNAYGPMDMVSDQFDINANPELIWLQQRCEVTVISRAKKTGMMDHPLVKKFLSL